jgi:hypothetical protein
MGSPDGRADAEVVIISSEITPTERDVFYEEYLTNRFALGFMSTLITPSALPTARAVQPSPKTPPANSDVHRICKNLGVHRVCRNYAMRARHLLVASTVAVAFVLQICLLVTGISDADSGESASDIPLGSIRVAPLSPIAHLLEPEHGHHRDDDVHQYESDGARRVEVRTERPLDRRERQQRADHLGDPHDRIPPQTQ